LSGQASPTGVDCGVGRVGEDGHDERAPKGGEPGEDSPEVVAGGGEHGVGGVALDAFEEVASHAVVALGVADDGLDGRAPAQVAFDGVVTPRFWPEI
jgi:hypothetical protein